MRRGFLEAVATCACAALLAAMWAFLQAGQAQRTLNVEIARTSLDIHRTIMVANNVALTQSAYYKKLGLDSTRLINSMRPLLDPRRDDSLPAVLRSLRGDADALHDMITDTNRNVNGPIFGLIPTTRTAVLAATGTLTATARVGNAAAKFVEDATPPAVSAIQHADKTAANVESTTGHVNNVANKYDHKLTDDKKETAWDRFKTAFWTTLKILYWTR